MSKKIEPFRFWCQTVLPLVYDDSLSYYELLCKVVEYLNQVIAQTNINSGVVAELYDYVHNYFESSDFRQLVNDKLDEMAQDGTLATLLSVLTACRVNVAAFVDEELSGENLNTAVNNALNACTCIFIPAGTYQNACVTVENKNCDILIDRNATFIHSETAGNETIFKFTGCSVILKGGCFTSNIASTSRDIFASSNRAMIELQNCNFNVISDITAYNSKHGAIIQIENCKFNTIRDCYFHDFILSAIHILYTCDNTIVTKCKFKNAYIASTQYYCYFVYTGVRDVTETDVSTPPTNIEYSFNECEDSEDCGLDTHGAQNVYIHDNKIINACTAITAYNDGRVNRPTGWVMKNVRIENNVCISNVTNSRHNVAYIFLSNDYNNRIRYENYIIKNNHFECTANTGGLIGLCCIRNVVFKNNICVTNPVNERIMWVTHCENAIFENNSFKGGTLHNIRFDHCNGIYKNNSGDNARSYYEGVTSYNYMEGSQEYALDYVPRMMQYGDTFSYGGVPQLVTSYGLRVRAGAYTIVDNPITIIDNIAETTNTQRYVAGQRILIGTTPAIVEHLIDNHHFSFTSTSTIEDGSYTCSAREVETYDLSRSDVYKSIENTVSADTLTTPGLYSCSGKLTGTPVPDATEFTQISVEEVRYHVYRQKVMGTTSGTYWVRTIGDTVGSWYRYDGT